jgi:hypothetical protein
MRKRGEVVERSFAQFWSVAGCAEHGCAVARTSTNDISFMWRAKISAF